MSRILFPPSRTASLPWVIWGCLMNCKLVFEKYLANKTFPGFFLKSKSNCDPNGLAFNVLYNLIKSS